jgi:hypothetical protein
VNGLIELRVAATHKGYTLYQDLHTGKFPLIIICSFRMFSGIDSFHLYIVGKTHSHKAVNNLEKDPADHKGVDDHDPDTKNINK